MLPDMMLLMHQRRADLLVAVADEAVRIERELMPPGLIYPAVEPISSKVAERSRLSLVRYKDIRQPAVEQLLVEVVVCLLQSAVLDRGDCPGLALIHHDRSPSVGWYD